MEKTKNVLFLVTGMTPAIITETIWALACDPQLEESERWIPDEVHVLSTTHGINQIKSKLMESGVFTRFKADFPQIAKIQLTDDMMHAITNEQQQPLLDLRTPEDNEFAADKINEYIRQLTQDDHISLHVSIAGGRKTMGFYAGYALSLHGRAQDLMSHVLVDERFETIPDFFYPTPKESFVKDRNGHSWDARTAQVWLAIIPFVRMKYAIKERHQVKTGSFSDTVRKINAANEEVSLKIDINNKKLIVNENIECCNLSPREFAFLTLFADDRKQQGVGICTPKRNLNIEIDWKKLEEPGREKEFAKVKQEIADIGELTNRFMVFYEKLRDESYLDYNEPSLGLSTFQDMKTGLKRQLELSLGLELATKLELVQNKRGMPFYLDIDPEKIEFIK